jgi:RNA polymerase sigma factor (sigma-70 family)
VDADVGGVFGAVGDPLMRRAARPAVSNDGVAVVEELFVIHRMRLLQLAAAITLNRALAEEVVQDAFMGLQRNLASIDNPAGYLHRSVVHRSISVLRRRHVASRAPSPVATIVISPEVDETWAMVARLPPRERAVVVLRFWEDLSEASIAATLGWPNGTVKSTLHRALKRLGEELNP